MLIPLILVQCFTLALTEAWNPFAYDDSYLTEHLDDRYPYLKNGTNSSSYVAVRDYFNFTHLHEPTLDYLEQVNLEQRLYEEIRSLEISLSIATMDQWHYSDADQELELDSRQANEEQCKQELEYLANQTKLADSNSNHLFERKGYRNQQLLRLLDSWGRPPAETYFGNSYWTGSYRGCKLATLAPRLVNNLSSTTDEFHYCWAKLRAKDWPEQDDIIPPTSIRVGVCLPTSCNSKLANKHRQLILQIMHFNFAPMHRARFNKIIHLYCLPRNNLPASGRLFLKLVAGWLVFLAGLSLLASIAGLKHKLPKLIYSLTIQENFRAFAANDEPPPAASSAKVIDLRPLGVVRFANTVLVCLAHCICSFGWVSYSSSFSMIESRHRLVYYPIIPAFKSNEIFWVLSGTLTSYMILNKLAPQSEPNRKQQQQPQLRASKLFEPKIYAGIIVARYLRLVCLQILLLAFLKTVYLSISDGPFWDYGTYKYSLQGQCQQSSWWRVLLFPIPFSSSSNSNKYLHECLPVTWFTVADLKLSLVAPVIIYLLASNSKLVRRSTALVLSVMSTLVQYSDLSQQRLIYFQQFFKYHQFVALNMLSLAFGETGYYNTLARLFPLMMGWLAGIYLHKYRHNQIKTWPSWMGGRFMWAMIGYQIYDWFAPLWAQYRYLHHGELPSEQTIKLALVLKPRLDAIIYAIIIARITTDLAPSLMSHAKPIYKLSKLSYSVLLVHPIVISYLLSADQSSRTDFYATQFVKLSLCCVCLSFLISFPLHILFESPVANLTGCLFKGVGKSSSSSSGRRRQLASSEGTLIRSYDTPPGAIPQNHERKLK